MNSSKPYSACNSRTRAMQYSGSPNTPISRSISAKVTRSKIGRASCRERVTGVQTCALPISPLSEMRHDFLGKQPHRLLHKRGVHQPSLVEVTDELVKTILGLQLPNPRDAIFRVTEHAHLAVHISKGDSLQDRKSVV